MISTLLFCAGLGVSGYVLARALFRSHGAQWAFAGLFVSSPLWPHLAEFNVLSWGVGIGCILVVFCFLLVLGDHRRGHFVAIGLLAFATAIYQNFLIWLPVLLCIRYVSIILGTAPVTPADEPKRFPWSRSGFVVAGGLVLYVLIQSLILKIFSMRLGYVQDYVRLSEFKRFPVQALEHTLHRSWSLVGGGDPIYLGYGYILALLPLAGLTFVSLTLLRQSKLTKVQRSLAVFSLITAFACTLSPIVVAAGAIPARALVPWVPLAAFLGAIIFSYKGNAVLEKSVSGIFAAVLIISIWISVSLFYTDHLARQRDEILAARIMAKIDQIVPASLAHRVPFVVIGAHSSAPIETFHRVEIFGTSFFEHDGGNPVRIAAYLRILGIDMLEPRSMKDVASQRAAIEALPEWPAVGSVAIINDILIIKLGPLQSQLETSLGIAQ